MASCVPGPSGESSPEAGVHAGDVWQEKGEPEEASSQTDQTCAAGRPKTWSLHQVTPQLAWWVWDEPLVHHFHDQGLFYKAAVCFNG